MHYKENLNFIFENCIIFLFKYLFYHTYYKDESLSICLSEIVLKRLIFVLYKQKNYSSERTQISLNIFKNILTVHRVLLILKKHQIKLHKKFINI